MIDPCGSRWEPPTLVKPREPLLQEVGECVVPDSSAASLGREIFQHLPEAVLVERTTGFEPATPTLAKGKLQGACIMSLRESQQCP